MEKRKKNIFISLYVLLWLAQAWESYILARPIPAVVMAIVYELVLTEKKPGYYILYCWCGFFTFIYGLSIYAHCRDHLLYDRMYMSRPHLITVSVLFALAAASIILTVFYRRALKAAGEEKERARAEKRRRRLDAKTAREQRGGGGSE